MTQHIVTQTAQSFKAFPVQLIPVNKQHEQKYTTIAGLAFLKCRPTEDGLKCEESM